MKIIDQLKHSLLLPVVDSESHLYGGDECFDPWEMFPCLYGSYSSEFDDMAITVLENIRDRKFGKSAGENLAHEMFREMLCTADLCDYGTSPRGCFPNWQSGFAEILPTLIDKWHEYRRVNWGSDS
jgi:hypothetical protein